MGTPYKMKGSPMQRNFGIGSPMRVGEEELVTYTDTNKPADYGGGDTSSYETKISKRTERLIKANAPKDVIEKSKDKDVEAFKASQN